MNFNKGVIRCSFISGMTSETIIAELHDQGVIDSRRISIERDGQTIEANTYVLTFNRLQLPGIIDVGYRIVRVEKYVRLLYNVATVSCMAARQRDADTKLLDVLVVERITNLMNVNKNQ